MAKKILFDPVESPYLVPFDESFKIKSFPTKAEDKGTKEENVEALEKSVSKIGKIQERLYANDHYSVLLIFQAIDAAGKDGTIRAVLTGLNPAGVDVHSFKQPNAEELDHDFLWRSQRALPERGRIGVWNRSHYEEVLVVRVHPEYLDQQHLPYRPDKLEDLWEQRYESIAAAEKHWARNGAVILKFFLNVSQKEQHSRFLDRMQNPDNHWKFSASDMKESEHWDDYLDAYQAALNATSKPWAPWYCIPADSKPNMRANVADIIQQTLKQLDLPYPELPEKALGELKKYKAVLEKELA
ncbi:polyphosphate kinase 2 family protein [soil metagenome]